MQNRKNEKIKIAKNLVSSRYTESIPTGPPFVASQRANEDFFLMTTYIL